MNVGQIQTQMQDLGYGSDTAAQQLDFINATYREIHSKQRWPFLEAIDTTQTTVAGTANYTPPMATWRNIDAVRIDQPSSNNYLDMDYKETQDLLDELHRNPVQTATPRAWTMYASQIWLYPVPDAPYRLSYFYINEPPDMVLSTDVPLLPVAFHDVITSGAICRMAFRQRDWIALELWTQKYETQLKRLEEEYLLRQRQTSSEVRHSGWWDTYSPYPLSSTGF